MHKPEFIQIFLPVSGPDVTPSVKRLFDRLHDVFVEVKFSEIRDRKFYSYKIKNSEAFDRYFVSCKKNASGFVISLKKYILKEHKK
jgi:hypothetical protein